MKILLAGDSWGCGEWYHEGAQILHKGIEQYLMDDGHVVENLSWRGISNLDIAHRIRFYFENYDRLLPDIILVFQTEYSRDSKHQRMQTDFGANDWTDIKQFSDLSDQWIGRFYQRLSDISQAFDVPVKIIGGCSDTMHFDCMDQDYPGCEIVCQSATHLILHNNHRISAPVFSWYTKESVDLVQQIKSCLCTDAQREFMKSIDAGIQREFLLRENPEFFWPDGVHPNRIGHKIIFDFLKSAGIFTSNRHDTARRTL